MAQESDKVTAASYGAVNADDVDKECWLLRIPTKLAEEWNKVPEGTVLGELVFKKGGKQQPGGKVVKPQVDIVAAPPPPTPDQATTKSTSTPLPLRYTLQAMTKKIPTMHPMVRHPNGSVTLKGTVSRTANCQVSHIQDSNYKQLIKNRLLNSTVNNNRFVKPVESNQVVSQSSKNMNSGSNNKTNGNGSSSTGFGSAVHQFGKRILEQANQQQSLQNDPNKKAKLSFDPDQPTRSVVFTLFQQQPFWTVKDLKVASGGRPEKEIRDVLQEIAEYRRSGDHKNAWELRKEFQNTAALDDDEDLTMIGKAAGAASNKSGGSGSNGGSGGAT